MSVHALTQSMHSKKIAALINRKSTIPNPKSRIKLSLYAFADYMADGDMPFLDALGVV